MTLAQLVPYLLAHGWRRVAAYKQGIQLYEGPPDAHGAPLAIALPLSETDPDIGMYMNSALHLLAALTQQPVVEVQDMIAPPLTLRQTAAALTPRVAALHDLLQAPEYDMYAWGLAFHLHWKSIVDLWGATAPRD